MTPEFNPRTFWPQLFIVLLALDALYLIWLAAP